MSFVYSLAPSLPAASWDELHALWKRFEGNLPELQVDIVDGVFAPHLSWPFTEDAGVQALYHLHEWTGTHIEIDAMCMHPESYLSLFQEVGATRVVIHAESTEAYRECLLHRAEHGYHMGLGIMNTTSWKLIEEWVPQFDYVQVMGIAVIGAQGQPFDERTLGTVSKLRAAFPEYEIAVDGAVNADTIPHLIEAGANRFLPGSAIAKSADPIAAYKQLTVLLPS